MKPETQIGQIEQAQQQLILLWLNNIESNSLAPTTNLNQAASLLRQAQISGQTLAFVAIGCADWHRWDTPQEKIWHIGKIDLKNKRANRFAQEVHSFQNALKSFAIDSIINFSLSNVEMNDPHRLPELDGRFDDQEQARINVDLSNQSLGDLLSRASVKFRLFNHWQLIQQLGFGQIFPTPPTTYQEYMGRLYAFDLAQTAQAFIEPGQLGPIWLDIQSFSFPELVSELRLQAANQAPALPILTPFKNCGNWHARPRPENHFPDIFQLMHSQLQLKPASSIPEWQQKTLKLPDEIILAALNALGVTDIAINDDWEKRKSAVNILASIAFNH